MKIDKLTPSFAWKGKRTKITKLICKIKLGDPHYLISNL